MNQEIVLATGNVHKGREIRDILGKFPGIEFLTFRAFPDYEAPPEDGDTFEANAIIKAKHAAQTLGKMTIADDSGLVVPALNGDPGVYSARYAGLEATDRDNIRKLLGAMQGLQEEQRYAYFVCVIAIGLPDGSVVVEEAKCEGQLLEEQRGSNGHGYDPLFIKHGYSRTFAELDEATKNRISHRRKAVDKARLRLESLL
jgi:XTP/dITP diphosphohydrolase